MAASSTRTNRFRARFILPFSKPSIQITPIGSERNDRLGASLGTYLDLQTGSVLQRGHSPTIHVRRGCTCTFKEQDAFTRAFSSGRFPLAGSTLVPLFGIRGFFVLVAFSDELTLYNHDGAILMKILIR